MGIRKNLITILSPVGNEAEIDAYIDSVNQNINKNFDKAKDYIKFDDDDWIKDFEEFTNIKYENLKEYFSRFR
tara:strand:+ start:884 stop:1102 length:219 start_codon:yes stop_codon:yes gene_type:complete